jgi:hypothetical protein
LKGRGWRCVVNSIARSAAGSPPSISRFQDPDQVALHGLQALAPDSADSGKQFPGARQLALSLKRLSQLVGSSQFIRVEFERLLRLLGGTIGIAATQPEISQKGTRLRQAFAGNPISAISRLSAWFSWFRQSAISSGRAAERKYLKT